MKKLILVLLLSLFAFSACSKNGKGPDASSTGWTRITSSTGGGKHDIYVYPTTTGINGSSVKMWKLLYWNKTIRSYNKYDILQMEYDCEGGRAKTLYFSSYDGNIGEGKLLFEDSSDKKWEELPQGSVEEHLLNIACGRE